MEDMLGTQEQSPAWRRSHGWRSPGKFDSSVQMGVAQGALVAGYATMLDPNPLSSPDPNPL